MSETRSKEESKQFRLREEKAAAQALAAKLGELSVKITASSGSDGRLYGSVTTKDIADELAKQHKISIDKRKLSLPENIKAYGTYNVEAKVYPEVTATLKVTVTQ
jgi:large subunit ribosomal protein L9